jgi:cell division septal protein FtsQ
MAEKTQTEKQEKPEKTEKSEKPEKQEKQQKKVMMKRPEIRVGLVVSLMMVFLVSVTVLFWMAQRSLFSKNPHFILKRVVVKSSGYWNARDNDVSQILGLEKGRTNLFSLKLGELRDKLREQASIERVSVARVLPSTVEVKISERIPRAYLYSADSGWIVDQSGVVMDSKTAVNIKGVLPVITGLRIADIHAGLELPEIKPALDIILCSLQDYPDLKVTSVSLGIRDEIHLFLRYKSYIKTFFVLMPRKKFDEKMAALNMIVKKNCSSDTPGATIDLRFENQGVIK